MSPEAQRIAIAEEVGIVAQLPCPFVVEGQCAIGGCASGPGWMAEAEIVRTRRAQFGFLPAQLLKAIDPQTLRYLVSQHQIADAKVTGLWRRTGRTALYLMTAMALISGVDYFRKFLPLLLQKEEKAPQGE